jgi:hypothetical protein
MARDWTKTGTIAAMGEWLRDEAGALCVMVIRRDDAILAADPKLSPADALELIEQHAPGLAAEVEKARREKRAAARLEFGPVPE